ncbi:NAD(P)-binding domain-containing protein [Sphingobacterium sp. N143]|uniref:NAD(P)H-dependent glycerol-3-phosphate dehydrogenase n=1 Tax=Sphingobacterium sp. N143 TaxID=2746727 RepID=UPI0025768548|nr:NAD(P)H-dependent glycerol-3-phosphate dehydrogenase [Sphingobacterium sp. N143]MDM1294185.1 NAD(P)-binding domain-containing protein [Sphingobacterium sp. N143]
MKEISIIGGGSWATALVKILTENKIRVYWYLRRQMQVEAVNDLARNPDYLSFVPLDKTYIEASTNLEQVISSSEHLLFVIPSAHLPTLCQQIDPQLLKDKMIISSIKGTVGPDNLLPSAYLAHIFSILQVQQAILAGPCHAEEIGMGKKTYMTICSGNKPLRQALMKAFDSSYMQVQPHEDLIGVEYAAIYKNVVGLVCGMAKGMNYGDNFTAVIVANAIHELNLLLKQLHHSDTRVACSSYLGDLFATVYSEHSRNRTFGTFIGQGYNVAQAEEIMSMVAEGYTATKGLYHTAMSHGLNLPILNTAYRVLYNHMPVSTEFKLLERSMI